MSTITINAAERDRLLAAYPDVFKRSFWQRWGLALCVGVTVLYLAICFVAFNVGPAFMQGRWDRASVYVQDWYSLRYDSTVHEAKPWLRPP